MFWWIILFLGIIILTVLLIGAYLLTKNVQMNESDVELMIYKFRIATLINNLKLKSKIQHLINIPSYWNVQWSEKGIPYTSNKETIYLLQNVDEDLQMKFVCHELAHLIGKDHICGKNAEHTKEFGLIEYYIRRCAEVLGWIS